MYRKISLVKIKFLVPSRAVKAFEHLEQHQSECCLRLRTEKAQLERSRSGSRAVQEVQDLLSVF